MRCYPTTDLTLELELCGGPESGCASAQAMLIQQFRHAARTPSKVRLPSHAPPPRAGSVLVRRVCAWCGGETDAVLVSAPDVRAGVRQRVCGPGGCGGAVLTE
eukprot:3288412-Rhodomonas_salina.3